MDCLGFPSRICEGGGTCVDVRIGSATLYPPTTP